jgi:L-asparaginase II
MLAMALHSGARIETYDHPNNPVQLEIANVIARFSGLDPSQLIIGTDGCGAPVFAMPVQAMALMYARLVAPPTEIDEELRDGCARIVNAMTRYPEMVGGTVDRLDTMLMQVAAGSLVSKIGAEGVYTVGVSPSTQWPRGLGLAIKIEDGDDRRARPIVVLEALRQLEILNEADLERFASFRNPGIRNLRGELVGEVRAEFAIRST